MKTICNAGFVKLTLSAVASAALAACGGGGGSGSATTTSNPSAPTASAQLTGKAIDGYLVGATVCFDNGQGACDPSLPSGTTDASGGYSLPDTGNLQGKMLLVTVTPGTKDLSRPGYTFPATFTLSQTVAASGQQNISPLTTMISAQMEAGLSQTQATAAVAQLLGGNVDPNADYIASSNAATASTASAILDKLTSFATNGVVDAATVRNTMNAIVAKGDVASVTLTDVQTQAAKPVFTVANASQVLSSPTYALDGYLPYFSSFNAQPVQAIVQDVRQLQGAQVTTSQQEYSSGTWQPVTNGKYETMYGAYELRNDASWSAFVPVSTYRAPLAVSANGTVLSGTDPVTGIGYSIEYRTVDLGGLPLATAVPAGNYELSALWTLAPLTTSTFSAATKAYVGLQSYSNDRVILPVWLPACDNPSIANGMVCDGAQPAVMEDGVISLITGDASTTYTSVRQAIGLNLEGRAGGFGMTLTADNKVTATSFSSGGQQTVVIGSWALYSRNANVIVMNVDPAQLAQLGTDPLLSPVYDGAKLVVGLRNGHLRMGFLYPSTYVQKTFEFSSSLNAQLISGVQTATTP